MIRDHVGDDGDLPTAPLARPERPGMGRLAWASSPPLKGSWTGAEALVGEDILLVVGLREYLLDFLRRGCGGIGSRCERVI